MSAELNFIEALRTFATHSAARGLNDDAAVLEIGGAKIILTHDTLVEGVHYLHTDPPESVAWKLLGVNLSDLAAKGGIPRGVMMSYTLSDDTDWDARFAAGLGKALAHFGVPLLGGDTVSAPARVLGLTLIGEASGLLPSRSGAHSGDALYVTGTIGDAGLGLELAQALDPCDSPLLSAYRTPGPQLAAGVALAGVVSAMMDISDGLLIDASRLAAASGLCAVIDLDAVPLSDAFRTHSGESRAVRLRAATAGDDYQLLFTCGLPLPPLPVPVTRIGQMTRGQGLILNDHEGAVPLPEKLGWLHGLP